MKFTIITVCYNAQLTIRNTIESVLMQSYRDFEYLIIDGESSDETISIIKEYQDQRIQLYIEKDFGIYNAMNRGICRAKGEFIYFLNAGDTLFSDDTLDKVGAHLTKSDTIYYGSVRCVKPWGIDNVSNYADIKGSITDKFLAGHMPCHQSIFAPKASLCNHFFKEKYKLRADYQWFYDSVFQGFLLEDIPIIVANYDTLGESGNTSNMELMGKETQQIQKEFFEVKNITIPNLEMPIQTEFEWKKMSDKHLKIVKLMDNWLSLRQKDISLIRYFEGQNLSSIAIYGLGHIGLRLLKEVEESKIVKFAIDKRKMEVCVPVKNVDEELDLVDAIVITTVDDYEEVITMLKEKNNCKLIRFDEIIHYCLNQYE